MGMMKPPPNYRVGQARGLATQKEAARRHDKEVWGYIVTIAIMEKPKTLREYAVYLTGLGVATVRGGPWSTGLVQRVMKARGVTPKSLLDRVTRPPAYRRKDWPVATYEAYRSSIDAINTPGPRTGEWLSVLLHEPEAFDLVRHAVHGEGQILRATALSRYLCSFVDFERYGGSFEIECPASELEAFKYRLTREERIAAGERAREWHFR
jgi:hypothetical protein